MATAPRPEQIVALAKNAPSDGPLFMLNLLKFRERARYADGRATELSGQEAYALYGRGVSRLVEQLGGRFAFLGVCRTLVIGDGELAWDSAAIVEYPSLAAFQQMTQSEAYTAIHVHREAGLEHQLLIQCISPEQAQALTGLS